MTAGIVIGILVGWAVVVGALYMRGRRIERRKDRVFDDLVSRACEPAEPVAR